MRVLHIIASISKLRGGTSQAVLDMVHALRAQGIDAEIATTNDNGDGLLNVPLQKLIKYEDVPVYFFARFSPPIKAVSEYAFSWELTAWLLQNSSQYDLIHVHALFSFPSTIAMAIARLKKVPYIVTSHGLLCEWSLQQSTRKKQNYLKLIERDNLNCSQTLHFTSEQEQREVSHLALQTNSFVLPLGLSQPKYIPNAPLLLREQFNIPKDEPIILFLSRLHHKKGLDYLIQALSNLTHHQFTFIIAGKGDAEYENYIDSLLLSSGIRNRTILAGFVEGEPKNLLLQGSNIFALTSYSENFAVSVLEALASGLPVLVTPGVALASIVKQHQLGYVPELEVSAIASALEQYLSNPQEGKYMSDRAHKLILANYTWSRITKQLIDKYTQIIGQNASWQAIIQ